MPSSPKPSDYLEGLLEGFVAYDADWVMTYMNAAAESLLGRKRADVLGKTWHQAFPHAVGNPVDQMYQRVMRTRKSERMEYFYAHYQRWLEISASPADGGVAVYFRDISDREALNRVGRTVASELDLERAVQAVTDAATELSGAHFGAFFYNRKNEAGESYMLYALSGVPREAFAGFGMPRNTAVFAPTFSGEATVRSDDITRDPRYGRSAPHHGMPKGHLPVRSYLAVPVVSRSGETIGGLFFGHPDAGVFTERAERLVTGIAAQAAVAIDNARLYRSLQESEQRYRAVVEDLTEMVCRFRLDGTILFVNAAYARSVGREPEAMQGRDFWEFIPEGEQAAVRQMLLRLTPAAPEIEIENRFRTQEGERWVLWRNRALAFDEAGRVLEAQSTGVDITDRKRAEEELREADRRKDEFLATLSHELRNPLAPLSSALQLLRLSGGGSESIRQIQELMQRQVDHLVRLVDDLLELSRVTRGTFELRSSRVQLADVLRHALETSDPLIRAAGHRLTTTLPGEPLWVDGDAVRLAQIFANILNNAAKYTPRGGSIEVRAQRKGNEALIAVRDSGMGIAAERLPRVFEMFNRGGPSSGLGIGLALAQRLARMHGGGIAVVSEGPGKGAEFTVRLPLAAPGRVETGTSAPALRKLAARRILVVDDNRDAAESLGELLRALGADVRVALSGRDALAAFDADRPELVLLDIGMPEMDGYEVARAIRERDPQRQVTLIALTGWGQSDDRKRAREAGFDHHLVKPADLSALQALLAGLP